MFQKSKYSVTGRMVEFQCRKVGIGENWPRLLESSQKPAWLRPDFDHFTFNDSDQSSNEENDNPLVGDQSKYNISHYQYEGHPKSFRPRHIRQ